MTENLKGIPLAWTIAKEIRARIFDELGLTASAGVSYNKFETDRASPALRGRDRFTEPSPDRREGFSATAERKKQELVRRALISSSARASVIAEAEAKLLVAFKNEGLIG